MAMQACFKGALETQPAVKSVQDCPASKAPCRGNLPGRGRSGEGIHQQQLPNMSQPEQALQRCCGHRQLQLELEHR